MSSIIKNALVAAFVLVASSGAARAVDPEEQLADPKLEARARHIYAGLRCLVCQNESIDDSDASLAKDLRLLVRQQLQKGKSDPEVVDYLVARYGEFVLLRPRFNARTLLLWGTPLLLLAGGGLLAARAVRFSSAPSTVAPLSVDEQKALDALLKDEKRS